MTKIKILNQSKDYDDYNTDQIYIDWIIDHQDLSINSHNKLSNKSI